MNKLAAITVLLFSQIAHAGIFESSVLWDKSDITVCFMDNPNQTLLTNADQEFESMVEVDKIQVKPFNKREQRKIIKTVSNAFSKEETGISFSGWKPCSESLEADVVVMKVEGKRMPKRHRSPRLLGFKRTPRYDVSFLGLSSIGEDSMMVPLIGFVKSNNTQKGFVSLETTQAAIVVHEFGHAAGLRHEQVNPDALRDPNCLRDHLVNQISFDEPIFYTTRFFSDYDPDSIMNYCTLFDRYYSKQKTNLLTQKDKETLRSLYQ